MLGALQIQTVILQTCAVLGSVVVVVGGEGLLAAGDDGEHPVIQQGGR